MGERSLAGLKSVPDTPLYMGVMILLLVGTTVALIFDADTIGIAAFLLLALMALAYGAVQTPEDIRGPS